MRIVSFDVFDTLLTRTFAAPGDLFLALGETAVQQGLIRAAPEEFAQLRIKAESEARLHSAEGEPNLSDIYARLSAVLAITPEITERLLKQELDLEVAAVRPVPGMRERVSAERLTSDRLLFLSDMYLPASFIQSLLLKHGFFQPADELFVSNDIKASKATGKLFSMLSDRFATGQELSWFHVGDNHGCDVRVPATLGISASLVSDTALTRYERLARGSAGLAPGWRSHLAGAMRLARLACSEQDPQKRIIWQTGANVVGPLLFGFVRWVLLQAMHRKLSRLYFIARDGQILHKIARQICATWGFALDCRYIYGSRQAWRAPAIESIGPTELEWLLPPDHDLAIEHVFARLGVPPAQLEPLLSEAGFSPQSWKTSLAESELARLGGLFLDKRVQALARETASRKRDLLLRYLSQEGLLDGVPFGIVDIGWTGNLQRSLSSCLRLAGHKSQASLIGFYFGLRNSTKIPEGQQLFDYWGELPEPGHELEHQNVTMFEAFTAADHGSTAGYQLQGERVVPVLSPDAAAQARSWGVPQLQAGVCAFCEQFLSLEPPGSVPPGQFQQVTRRVFELFYLNPQPEEARVWGTFPLAGQAIENVRGQIIPTWSRRELLASLADYRKRPHGWWPEGTLAVHPSLALSAFLRAKALRRLLGRVARRRNAHKRS